MKLKDFQIGDEVTPISNKNHAFGEIMPITEIWPKGRGGKDGIILC
jgi:hypothetical protein